MSKKEASEKADTLRLAMEVAGQVMFEYDQNADRLSWTSPENVGNFLGVSSDAQIDTQAKLVNLISPEDVMAREGAVQSASSSGRGYAVEYRVKAGDGSWRWYEERGSWLNFGGQQRLVGVIRAIQEQKARETRLSWLASYDELTGQLNRQRIKELLSQHISMAETCTKPGAYIMVGIDNLGVVNNDFGFDAADEVIVETSARLRGVLTDTDAMGRVAGTKFGIVLHNTESYDVRTVCNKLLGAVRESVFTTQKGSIAASVCAGVAMFDADVLSADIAMARAEAALDAARQIGPSSWSQFSEKTETVTRRKRFSEMSDIILTALNERRIELAYQPIVSDLHDERTKFECLIRMIHKGEEISAPNFIPVAERLGLVHLLDRRVLELATQALRRKPEVALNLNISWETVKDPVWAEGYLSHLRAHRDVASRITVELTETQVVDAVEASKEFVSEIKDIGCHFAIDDFGAGYTSFRNLKALDIDVLKIDGSFVTGVSSSRENQLFVRTLLDLARNFGMKTVAEWVDNDADAMLLKGLGVDYLQGFYIGRPEKKPEWTQSASDRPNTVLARQA